VTRVVVKVALALVVVWAAVVMGARLVGESGPTHDLLAFSSQLPRTISPTRDIDIFLLDMSRNMIINFTNAVGFDTRPVWSSDGSEIYFISDRDGNYALYNASLANPSPRPLMRTNTTQNEFMLLRDVFAWSPSSQWIATSTRLESGYRLSLMNLGTGDTLDFTEPNGELTGLAWSPSGIYLAASIYSRLRGYALAIVNVESGELELIGSNTDCSYYDPEWASDNQHIAVQYNCSGNPSLRIADLENASMKRLSRLEGAFVTNAEWSHDNTQIAYIAWYGENTELQIVNADGTESRVLIPAPGRVYDFQWIPNRDAIVFQWCCDVGTDFYTVEVDSGVIQRLTMDTFVSENTSFSWQP
jgi:Tol biopolymer transport system component